MTMMLASVRSLDEALIALEGGADLIDLKEPSRGALGALDHAAVRICVQAIGGRRPVSATIGDLPSMDPQLMTDAVDRMAATGVDFIKIGFFSHPRAFDCAKALSKLASRARLVAVLFADEPYDLALVDELALQRVCRCDAGHCAQDRQDALRLAYRERTRGVCHPRSQSPDCLRGWPARYDGKTFPRFLRIGPDYLGFRGALCRNGDRGQILDQEPFAVIRNAIPQDGAGIRRAAA